MTLPQETAKRNIEELISLAEDGYKLHKSNGCHQEFLQEDREVLSWAKENLQRAMIVEAEKEEWKQAHKRSVDIILQLTTERDAYKEALGKIKKLSANFVDYEINRTVHEVLKKFTDNNQTKENGTTGNSPENTGENKGG